MKGMVWHDSVRGAEIAVGVLRNLKEKREVYVQERCHGSSDWTASYEATDTDQQVSRERSKSKYTR